MTADYPTEQALSAVTLERIATRIREHVSPSVAADLELRAHRSDRVLDLIALDVVAKIWTEQLPPQHVTVDVNYAHPEAVGAKGAAEDLRFATWLDHLTATYRRRWWAKLIGLSRRRIRYVTVTVPYVVTAPVRCRHRVVVDIADAWRFPEPPGIPGDLVGAPVLISSAGGSATRRSYDPLREAMDYREW